jgi:DNA ligase 1
MLYKELAYLYDELSNTQSRLKKTYILSNFIKKIEKKDYNKVMLLIQGRVFPLWDSQKIGVSAKIVEKTLSKSAGISEKEINELWKKMGDLGEVAFIVFKKRKHNSLLGFTDIKKTNLTIDYVLDNIQKMSKFEGNNSVDNKKNIILDLLTKADEIEVKYIVRTILEDLRVGAADGVLRDAITWAFFSEDMGFSYDENENNIIVENREIYNKYIDLVQSSIDLTNDFGKVLLKASEGEKSLKNLNIEIGIPIKVMLALKATSINDGFERCLKPCCFEYKYDGFRIQIHKDKDNVILFTRRLENVTEQFPDIVDIVKKNVNCDKCILDGEAVGYDSITFKYLPFQSISQRIRRKYNIDKMSKNFPVEVAIFDIIYKDGDNLITRSLKERKEILKEILIEKEKQIIFAKSIVTDNEIEAEKFYQEALSSSNEGLMIKNLNAPYKPGSRVGFMLKLKPVMDPLELVITGAEWGEGKRANWFSSFTLSCIDEDGKFIEIGKLGTGIKEKEEQGVSFEELTNLLKPLIISEKDKYAVIKPKVVVEVSYQEIQKSPTYTSGYALRFPSLNRLRVDKNPDDIALIDDIEELYYLQKK